MALKDWGGGQRRRVASMRVTSSPDKAGVFSKTNVATSNMLVVLAHVFFTGPLPRTETGVLLYSVGVVPKMSIMRNWHSPQIVVSIWSRLSPMCRDVELSAPGKTRDRTLQLEMLQSTHDCSHLFFCSCYAQDKPHFKPQRHHFFCDCLPKGVLPHTLWHGSELACPRSRLPLLRSFPQVEFSACRAYVHSFDGRHQPHGGEPHTPD